MHRRSRQALPHRGYRFFDDVAFPPGGGYHRAEAGTVHLFTSSEEGCLALVMTSTENEPAD